MRLSIQFCSAPGLHIEREFEDTYTICCIHWQIHISIGHSPLVSRTDKLVERSSNILHILAASPNTNPSYRCYHPVNAVNPAVAGPRCSITSASDSVRYSEVQICELSSHVVFTGLVPPLATSRRLTFFLPSLADIHDRGHKPLTATTARTKMPLKFESSSKCAQYYFPCLPRLGSLRV